MGLSTFIEINNDYLHEIELNPNKFLDGIVEYVRTGKCHFNIPSVTNITTIHRDEKSCSKISSLIKDSNHAE